MKVRERNNNWQKPGGNATWKKKIKEALKA